MAFLQDHRIAEKSEFVASRGPQQADSIVRDKDNARAGRVSILYRAIAPVDSDCMDLELVLLTKEIPDPAHRVRLSSRCS